jgi:hypothetical protein
MIQDEVKRTTYQASNISEQIHIGNVILKLLHLCRVEEAIEMIDARLPSLQEVINLHPPYSQVAIGTVIDKLKTHIAHLVQQALFVPEEEQDFIQLPELIRCRKKAHRDKTIQTRLAPTSSQIHALEVDDTIITDEKKIAEAIKNHWETVFQEKPIRLRSLRRWLIKFKTRIGNIVDTDWQITRAQVEIAIKQASASSPGPDGIPYAAYQGFDGSTDIILAVCQALLDGKTPPSHMEFNHAFLVCLPKKPVRSDPGGFGVSDCFGTKLGEDCKPGSTRFSLWQKHDSERG